MSSIAPSMQELRKAMNGNRDDGDAIYGVVVAKSKRMGQWMKSEFRNNYTNISNSDIAKYVEKLFGFGTTLHVPIQVTDSDEECNLGSKIKREKYIDGNDYDDDKKCKEDGKSDLIGNEEKCPVQVDDPGFDDNDCDDGDVKKLRKNLIDMVEKSVIGAERSAVRRLVELVMSISEKTITSLCTLLRIVPPSLLVVLIRDYLPVAAAKSFGGSPPNEMLQDLANLLLNTTNSTAHICLSTLPYNVSGVAHLPGCRFTFPSRNSTVCNGLSVHVKDNYLNLFGNASIIASLYQILVKEGIVDRLYNVKSLINHCILDNETLTGTSNGFADLMFDMNLPNNTCTVGKTVEKMMPASNMVGNSNNGMVAWIAVGIVFIALALCFGGVLYKKWKWLKGCCKKPSNVPI